MIHNNLESAVKALRDYPLEQYLTRFFHAGAREFRVLDTQDPLEAIELAYLQEADYDEPKQLFFEPYTTPDVEGRQLVKVWQLKEYLRSQERKEVVRAEMQVVAADLAARQAKEAKVKAAFIRMYGVSNGPRMFAAMMNGDMDIPGEQTERERFGL